MNVLDLFSGIGGFSLGLERAGMRTVAFCEIDPYCRAVLGKRWPGVQVFDDVRRLNSTDLWIKRCLPIHVICGGFPCQDISGAGKRVGIEGERSGLWSEFARLIGEIRPSYAIVENVAALLGRGIERVLGDLSEIGYDAEWHVVSAADIGAPHLRERVWIVAYPISERLRGSGYGSTAGTEGEVRGEVRKQRLWLDLESGRKAMGHAASKRLPNWAGGEVGQPSPLTEFERPGGREVELDFCGMAHGVSSRVDRLRSLGNAVIPQIPEIIGQAILRAEAEKQAICG